MPEPAPAPPGRALAEVARTMRGSIGSLRAAAETLEKCPGVEGAPRARLLEVVAQESERLSELVRRVEQIAQVSAVSAAADPAGANLTVGELAAGLARAAEALGFELAPGGEVDAALAAAGLGLPGAPALAAVSALLAELRREMAVTRLRVGVERVDRHLLLDLGWNPDPADLVRLLDWQGAALDPPPGPGSRRGLRPLARDHDGEAWFILERDGSAAHVKVLLPLAAAPVAAGR